MCTLYWHIFPTYMNKTQSTSNRLHDIRKKKPAGLSSKWRYDGASLFFYTPEAEERRKHTFETDEEYIANSWLPWVLEWNCL